MKLYFKLVAVLLSTLLVVGVALPYLFSGGTELVFAGVVLAAVWPVVLVQLFKKKGHK